MKIKTFLAAAMILSASAFAQVNADIVIADLEGDFKQGTPAVGWQYLWNANGQTIGSGAYTALSGTLDYESVSTDAVGVAGGGGNNVSFVGLSPASEGTIRWIMSGRPHTNSADTNDHYAIARYTIQAGEAGEITFNGQYDNQSGGTIALYVNNVSFPAVTRAPETTGNSSPIVFTDIGLGNLVAGDTVDIAFLSFDSDSLQTRNRRRYFLTGGNSGILTSTAVPEPSSLALLGFGIMGLVARRRR